MNRSFVPLLASVIAAGCIASPQKRLVFEKTIDLAAGRFSGPLDVQLPKPSDHQQRALYYVVDLEAVCSPMLALLFGDGTKHAVGKPNNEWQGLLFARATYEPLRTDVPALATPTADATTSTPPSEPTGAGPSQSTSSPAMAVPGHWQQTTVESWPGQARFVALRDQVCKTSSRSSVRHISAVEGTGILSVFAEHPQELARGKLHIKVFEIIDPNDERARGQAELSGRVAASAEASVVVSATPTKPPPPPKKEKPKPAQDPSAQWVSGKWQWEAGGGKWVWIAGYWGEPSTKPALRAEGGTPPIEGATWSQGHWVWVHYDGRWTWQPGHWLPPPPKPESPGLPPIESQSWIAGHWNPHNGSFVWVSGRWSIPKPKLEVPGPPPFAGALWIAGMWIPKGNSWVWSPGSYNMGQRPPAAKSEQPGPAPQPGAIWLSGFWRWTSGAYAWVDGRWEIPPGVGYEWVWDTPNNSPTTPPAGHWVPRVDINVNVNLPVIAVPRNGAQR